MSTAKTEVAIIDAPPIYEHITIRPVKDPNEGSWIRRQPWDTWSIKLITARITAYRHARHFFHSIVGGR